jgi:Family of unknown function (DUF6599)
METRDGPRSCREEQSMGRFSRLLVGFAVVVFLASCSSKKPSKNVSFFPDSNQVPGWTRSGETRTFPADRLWEYIDGDADKYIQAGVERTLATDYLYREKVEAVADVYVMSAPGGAQKILDSQASNGSQAVPVGDAGRLYQGSLSFRKGRYFIRVVAYQESPDLGNALVALGHGIEGRLSN